MTLSLKAGSRLKTAVARSCLRKHSCKPLPRNFVTEIESCKSKLESCNVGFSKYSTRSGFHPTTQPYSTMDEGQLKHYLADSPPTIVPLVIKSHFEALTHKQKLYAHYISVASWSGTRIVLRQVSPESEAIYDLILEIHRHCKGDWKSLQKESGLSDSELQAVLDYAAQFLGNLGNYKSFGDSKFVPRISERQFKALSTCSKKTLALFEHAKSGIFSAPNEAHMLLGYPDQGHISAYYPDSPTITKDEIIQVSEFIGAKGLLPENNRLRKPEKGKFEILIASADKSPDDDWKGHGGKTEYTLDGKLDGQSLKLVWGDHEAEMMKAATNMHEAADNAANDTQEKMCLAYSSSFASGSLEEFKKSQRYWIRDKGPDVECNIGFIETYRDPRGIRGEWEGLVAMVNKERTKAFGKLVESAPQQIPKLPWGKEFEKDKFLSPDFTSLEVLTFAGSGIPAGINIPNYDDIRQQEGFKNVSLGNVLSAKAPNEPVPFIKEDDLELYRKYRDVAFEVQVGLHELLGHGCGKLLQETSKGVYNFDIDNPPISPIDNKPITSWYKPGQTWGGVFGSIAASYEECRAECVAMALGCDFEILKIFGLGDGKVDLDSEAGDVLYASYLSMARAGVAALEFWDPKSKKWGQAHMQARFSILKTFLSAGKEFADLEYTKDDLSDLTIKIDRSKILSHGRPAVENYLQKLAIYKATADVEAGTKLYEDITLVDEWWGTSLRSEVMRRKVPRKVFVQANTFSNKDGEVTIKEYNADAEGMIQSFVDREDSENTFSWQFKKNQPKV